MVKRVIKIITSYTNVSTIQARIKGTHPEISSPAAFMTQTVEEKQLLLKDRDGNEHPVLFRRPVYGN
jgi:hypothetical protein